MTTGSWSPKSFSLKRTRVLREVTDTDWGWMSLQYFVMPESQKVLKGKNDKASYKETRGIIKTKLGLFEYQNN